MEWNEDLNLNKGEQRHEVGCATCARKNWIDYRYPVYLWREPEEAKADDCPEADVVLENPLEQEGMDIAVSADDIRKCGRAAAEASPRGLTPSMPTS